MAKKRQFGKETPLVIFTRCSPYMVVGLENFKNAKGKKLPLGTGDLALPMRQAVTQRC